MNIAILGAGNIAGTMAETLRNMEQVNCYAVASRDLKKAETFAAKYGFEKAYGSYEEMVQDDRVELVYIATPHSHHGEHALLCINHGRPVLCEKAFTATYWQAEEVLRAACEKHVFAAEAIWTRYMPSRQLLNDMVSSGIIGEVTSLTANLGYAIKNVPRMEETLLAGGALLDLGVYPINFASMVFGSGVESVCSKAVLTPSGVDARNSITLCYEDGKMAVLHSTMQAQTDRKGFIYGSKGYIMAENINNISMLRSYDPEHRMTAECTIPEQISGYEYEVEACIRSIRNGEIECPEMPHSETLRIMKLMDDLRAEWGVRYPFDR